MISKNFYYVVLQPTTLCNLDCKYCYLPDRKSNSKMSVDTVKLVAESVAAQKLENPVVIVWHGGEPTAVGVKYFESLLQPFEELRKNGKVIHNIQTNGTLINDQWCRLFIDYGFEVGVSIDGPIWANKNRLDWAGKQTHSRILSGISKLREHKIDFSLLAVVSNINIDHVEELYTFFTSLGASRLGINFEEEEGVNLTSSSGWVNNDSVKKFWQKLFALWVQTPTIKIREFDRSLSFIEQVLDENLPTITPTLDPFPTIAWNGDVYLLSPEFAGIKSEKYHDFIAGNIKKKSLFDIIGDATRFLYVEDFLKGVSACKQECPYFGFCIGGQASNKYFELGTTNGTETSYCRNTQKNLLDSVLEYANQEEIK